jgi:hypothetical protein
MMHEERRWQEEAQYPFATWANASVGAGALANRDGYEMLLPTSAFTRVGVFFVGESFETANGGEPL